MFNGSSSYINIPNSTSLQFNGGITFSTWLYASAFPYPVAYWFSKGADGGTPYSWTSNVVAGTKKATVSIFDNNNQNCGASSTTSLLLNTWIHVVHSFDGSFARTYVNGVLESSISCSYSTFSNSYALIFGRRHISGLPYFWNGKIDDFGLWNRALTQEEVTALYTGTTSTCDTTSSTIEAEITQGETYPFNGQNLGTAGTYTDTLTNAAGCDSLITLHLAVLPSNPFTLYMDTVSGINGQQALVHVRAKNFSNMLSAQFTLQFNPAVINYASYEQAGIPSITGSSFGLTQASSGIVTFAWNQPNGTPVSLSDGSILFTLRFNVTGSGGQFSAVQIINSPTPIEFVDQTFIPLTAYTVYPGRVNILSVVSLSGRLKTESGQGIRSASVNATGFTNATTTSALDGTYGFTLPQNEAYSITPSKNNDTLATNGITTLDVLLIQRHILNILQLGSPYKRIAADVNLSGTITSADINLINALILANISTYPSGRFWSFVPDNHVFANPQNPFPFPSERTYTNLGTTANQDFIGMKLGDVNNTYNSSIARLGSTDSVTFYLEHYEVAEESLVHVPVRVRHFNNIAGFQFALQWNPDVLSYVNIDSEQGGLEVNTGETMVEQGRLNINWIEPNASTVSFEDDEALFVITFEVKGALGSSSPVSVFSSLSTPIEVIDENLGLIMQVETIDGLVSVTEPSSIAPAAGADVNLKVYPNPYNDLVTISIGSTRVHSIVAELYDLSGRLLRSHAVPLSAGKAVLQTGDKLSQGTYLLVIRDAANGTALSTMRLVKN